VLGSIRSGRSDEQKARIVSELIEVVAGVLGREPGEVGVATVDVPAQWNMEGGELLPEPGEEAAWLARHR
jgi:phenylpyruvate tautomerase PptA (4-oxalocrotonate tautomerase family)